MAEIEDLSGFSNSITEERNKLFLVFKNYKESQIVSYLETHKLACHIFIHIAGQCLWHSRQDEFQVCSGSSASTVWYAFMNAYIHKMGFTNFGVSMSGLLVIIASFEYMFAKLVNE